MKDFISVAVIAVVNKMFNICQNGESSVMLIQLIKGDSFSLMIVNSVEVAGLNDSDMQIFIIRNKKLFQFIDVDSVLIYMQVIQIEAFKLENTDTECMN